MDVDATERRLVGASLGTLASVVLASWLVLVRDHVGAVVVALALGGVVYVAARCGGLVAGACAAGAALLSLDFFDVRPYGVLKSPVHAGALAVSILVLAAVAGSRAARRDPSATPWPLAVVLGTRSSAEP